MNPTEIRELRASAGLSQKAAADLLHVTEHTFWRYEAGRRVLSAGLAELLKLKIQATLVREEH